MTPRAHVDLESVVTGRRESFFGIDVRRHAAAMRDAVAGRTVLVAGGGGSIGSATVRALVGLRPAAIHVVDLSENYLAELIRDVRSTNVDVAGVDLQTHVFDYGSPTMRRFLGSTPRVDVVMSFAAVKHVRSEKDSFSLLHMLDVNILKQARFKQWVAERGHRGRYFAVSTDKAANPSSLMGASKRVMEDVAFDVAADGFAVATAARFANVAFSNGSLLQAFLARIAKRQPLAVPRDTRRYFISHAEAADICLLAGLVGATGQVLVPTFAPEEHLLLLEEVVERVLHTLGYRAYFTDDEAEAKRAMGDVGSGGRWPVLRTPLDTSGEKPYEEFVGSGERTVEADFDTLRAIPHVRDGHLAPLLDLLARYVDDWAMPVDKDALRQLLIDAVPTMRHVETGRHLDTRM